MHAIWKGVTGFNYHRNSLNTRLSVANNSLLSDGLTLSTKSLSRLDLSGNQLHVLHTSIVADMSNMR